MGLNFFLDGINGGKLDIQGWWPNNVFVDVIIVLYSVIIDRVNSLNPTVSRIFEVFNIFNAT